MSKKVRIRVTETWSHAYVVDVPDDLKEDEIAGYVDEGISCNEYDIDPVRDCGEYDRKVELVEVVKSEGKKLIDNLESVIEQCEIAVGREVACVLEKVREYIINAEKSKKEE